MIAAAAKKRGGPWRGAPELVRKGPRERLQGARPLILRGVEKGPIVVYDTGTYVYEPKTCAGVRVLTRLRDPPKT